MPALHPDHEAAIEVGQEFAERRREAFKAAQHIVPFGSQSPRDTDEWRARMDGDARFRESELNRFKQIEGNDTMAIDKLLQRWKGQ